MMVSLIRYIYSTKSTLMKKSTRRTFLHRVGMSTAGLALAPTLPTSNFHILHSTLASRSADPIQIGLIGSGIIGHYDTDTALKVEGVKLRAVCDLYTGRLDRAKEKWGPDVFTTRDYRVLLQRKDIDAVLICTSDNWHQKIAIDALAAGKHVYCEKPMVQYIEQGHALIDAHHKSGKVFQVGSQRASSVAILKAKEYYEKGIIGELTNVQAKVDRWNANGAWNYSIPTDATPETVDFDTFLGTASKVPFDATRFFRWRNYKEYGTGVAGDLFVHLLTGVHTITGSKGPNEVFALGALNYWKDGRNAYDLVSALFNYPSSEHQHPFQFFTQVNLANGSLEGGFGCQLIGTEGIIDIGWNDFKIRTLKRPSAPEYGGYDSFDTFSEKQQKEFVKWYDQTYKGISTKPLIGKEISYESTQDYDDRLDHMIVFFNAIRSNAPGEILEDAVFGLRSAAPSIACNLSAELGKKLMWDPEHMVLEV